MDQRKSGVWLGRTRNAVRIAMLVTIATTALLSLWLIFGKLFLDTGIGLKQFLSPAEAPIVFLTLVSGASALSLSSLYLSDNNGVIEVKPSGFFDVCSLIVSRITMIATALVVFVMFYEVVSRYLFAKPTLWANELSLWLAGFVFLFSGIYAMQQRSHIRIYVVYDLFPRWLQKTCDVISLLLLWFFVFLIVWGGYNEALTKFLRWETFGTAWDPPLPATIKPAILITMVLVAVQALSNLISDWNEIPEHRLSSDDIDETEIEMIRKSIEDN